MEHARHAGDGARVTWAGALIRVARELLDSSPLEDADMDIPVTDRATLTRHFWAFLLRGIAAISFSVLTFVAPHVSLATLVLLFGAYALVDGLFALI